MAPDLLQLAFVQHQDAVRHPHSRKTMGDQYRRPPPGQVGETLEHLIFRPRIQRRRRLIQDQQLGIPHIGPGQRDLLPFPARQVHPLAKIASQLLIIPVRQFFRKGIREALPGSAFDQLAIFLLIDIADSDILRQRHLIAPIVLEDDPDLAAKGLRVIFPQVDPIQQDPAFRRIIKPGQQFDQGGLTGPVLSHQGQLLAGAKGKAQMTVCPAFGMQVAEPDILKSKPFPDRTGKRAGVRRPDDPGLDLEEFKEVLKVDSSLADTGEAGQYTFQQTAQLPERAGQEGEVADRKAAVDSPGDNDYIGAIISGAAQQGKESPPGRPADRERLSIPIEFISATWAPVTRRPRK